MKKNLNPNISSLFGEKEEIPQSKALNANGQTSTL